jgi:hypothetical protein
MTDRKPPDLELDDYVAGRHPLSARYRDASRETTTPELDAAILAQARDAVRVPPVLIAPQRAQPSSNPPKPARLPWQQRWAVPVGIAATLMIGVDLAWRVSDRLRGEQTAAAPSVRLDEPTVASAPIVAPPPLLPAPAVRQKKAEAMREDAAAVEPGAQPPQNLMADASVEYEAAPPTELAPPPPATMSQSEVLYAPAVAVAEAGAEPGPSADVAGDAPSEIAAIEAGDAEAQADRQRALRAEAQAASRVEALAARRAEAPSPSAAAKAVAPVPRRDATAAGAAAEEVTTLLRAGDIETLQQRYAATSLTRQALADAANVLAAPLERRLRADDDGSWRVDFVDSQQRTRCTLRLMPLTEGWQLVGLVTRPD